MPEHTAVGREDAPAPELPVTLDVPGKGKVADFLRAAKLEPAERAAPDHGVTVRRGQGYTLRVSALPSVHRGLLARCQSLDGAHVRILPEGQSVQPFAVMSGTGDRGSC
ncbi:hypothetical protein [Streptomyces triculaminicus]|uniref:hypothetical protein n=1 Tax=Streptomyces triculaminicus TaxID=2816232 RepID=UPI0037AD86D0